MKILQLGEHKGVFQICILIMAMLFNWSGIVVLKVIEEEKTVSLLDRTVNAGCVFDF